MRKTDCFLKESIGTCKYTMWIRYSYITPCFKIQTSFVNKLRRMYRDNTVLYILGKGKIQPKHGGCVLTLALDGGWLFNVTPQLLYAWDRAPVPILSILCEDKVPVAARSKAWVWGRSPAGIVGSNPAGAWVLVRYECCVLSGKDLCVGLNTPPEES